MYNCELWPGDVRARRGIDHEVTITCGCSGQEYLARLGPALEHCFKACKPDIVLYNAGTDVLAGDPLGRCKASDSCFCSSSQPFRLVSRRNVWSEAPAGWS